MTFDAPFLATFLKTRAGLVITADKTYLIESRLQPVARKHKFPSLAELVTALKFRPSEAVVRDVIDAMTTHETSFFRDTRPFEVFRTGVLPKLLAARTVKKSLRIWCAAASSGQEPYSLAMILKEEAAKLAGWRIEILGTDISHDVCEKARQGIYSQFEVQRGTPSTMLVKYFQKVGDNWQVKPEIREMVQFRAGNLLDNLTAMGQFDVVFCRNVLIYFDPPTKTRVLGAISRQMADDGVLFLGGAETVLGVSAEFQPIAGQRGAYQVAPRGQSALKKAG